VVEVLTVEAVVITVVFVVADVVLVVTAVVVVVVVGVVVVVVELVPQEVNSIAATSKTLRLNQINLSFTFFLLFFLHDNDLENTLTFSSKIVNSTTSAQIK
jgi:hypothetical protein